MSGIEELRLRVAEAEKRFGLINEQRSKYSERLVGLIDTIETRLRDQQAEIERQAAELAGQHEELEARRHEPAENQALRAMLHSLLQAIEAGSRDVLTETMQAMDAKVSTLIADSVALAPALQPLDLDAAETAVSETPLPEDQASETEQPQAVETEAAEAAELEPAPDSGDELTEGQVAELLGAANLPEGLDDAPAQDTLETLPAEDEPKAGSNAGAEAELPDAEDAMPLSADEDGIVTNAAADDVMEPDGDLAEKSSEDPGIAAPQESGAAIDDLVLEDAADPDCAAIGGASDAKPEAANLEDIMRRVSRLIEEDGALGPLAAGGVKIGAATREAALGGPKAASNG